MEESDAAFRPHAGAASSSATEFRQAIAGFMENSNKKPQGLRPRGLDFTCESNRTPTA
jgi:hypothetical protein